MGKEELGLWFLLGQSGAFLALMDMGAAPVLIRHIAFSVASGSGREELADLLVVANAFYRFQAIAVFILAWICGVLFFGLLNFEQIGRETAIIVWTVLCFGHGLTVWSGVLPCILQGTGHIGSSLIPGMIFNIIITAGQAVSIFLGGGLLEMSIIFVLGTLAIRYSTLLLLKFKEPQILNLKGTWNPALFRKLLKPALRSWVTALGGFALLKTDQYFIASFKSVSLIPAYHAAYQIISNIYMLAVSLAGATGVHISYLWQSKSFRRLNDLILRNMQIALAIMVCGIVCISLVGEDLLNLWLGKGNYIGDQVIALFCVTLLLQVQHEMLISFTRSTGLEIFVYSAVAAGGINVILTIILIKPFGVAGVAVSTLLAQLLTNNWYGVWTGLSRFNISLQQYFREVIFPVMLTGVVALTFGYGIMHIVNSSIPHVWRILPILLVCAAVLSAAIWYFISAERLKYANGSFGRGLIK